ncbi:nucleotidyltransferase family protein [Pseudomonas sp. R-28-1W-6]|uniref:nucleotidyltransferase family protein n=1 Tax=Pseudomonas sp. R-28-1W-6 TaxID=2650101 RepID=UPI00273DA422|nr:nucleotidyltransferase family protein [Pseudomonas sp. R-28-1W-6]
MTTDICNKDLIEKRWQLGVISKDRSGIKTLYEPGVEVEVQMNPIPMAKDECTRGVAALVLAAGYSRRFGSDKRKVILSDGATLLNASLTPLHASFEEIWLVLRPDDAPVDMRLMGGVRVIQDSATTQGMGHSISVGTRELIQRSKASSVAICLADMPHIKPRTLLTLATHASPSRIVVPRYAQQRGHPVLFGRNFWPYLCDLNGDRGAKSVMDSFPDAVDLLDVDDPGVLLDVDTVADLSRDSSK